MVEMFGPFIDVLLKAALEGVVRNEEGRIERAGVVEFMRKMQTQ